MRAIVQGSYGGTEVLAMADREIPTPGPSEVLVAVKAAGVDRGTWHLMTGHPFAVRVAYGLRRPKHATPGRDFAGVVTAVGSEVMDFAAGDEVIGTADGSFSEFVVAPVSRVAHKPKTVSFAQAATVPVSGVTALQAVRDYAQVQAGQRVLVIGAAGGVGSYAAQIALALGAEVVGVAGPAKLEFVRSLGVSEVIDYSTEDINSRGTGYDAVIDTGGNRSLSELIGVLAPTGTLVIVGAETSGWLLGGAGRQVRAILRSKFVQPSLKSMLSRERGEDFATLAKMIDNGEIAPQLDRTFDLNHAGEAIDYLATGSARGKVAVTV